jgi:hypothetical protein
MDNSGRASGWSVTRRLRAAAAALSSQLMSLRTSRCEAPRRQIGRCPGALSPGAEWHKKWPDFSEFPLRADGIALAQAGSVLVFDDSEKTYAKDPDAHTTAAPRSALHRVFGLGRA